MKYALKSLVASFALVMVASAAMAQSKPVAIVGMESPSAQASVDSALTDSMDQPVAPEKAVKKAKAVNPDANAGDDSVSVPKASSRDYKIKPGDILQVTVWKEDNLDREVLVLPDGTIDFPLIGSFNVQGMTPAQVQATIKNKLRPMIPAASVAVIVKATLGHSVSVIGQVNKPGEILMGHNLSVMQALSQAGGLTPYASENSIKILRSVNGQQTAIEFPYRDISQGRNLEKNITLQPGDVVVVPTASLF